MVDYKGKHFILQDKEDDVYLTIGEIDTIGDLELLAHVRACVHYGIPPYIGTDKHLIERIDAIYKYLKISANMV